MPDKPGFAEEYSGSQSQLVKKACLYLATKLGDHIHDLVVVGGMVPSLLIDQENLSEGIPIHVGTRDLDIGIALGILEKERYRELSARLRDAGFGQDRNEDGQATRQRWKFEAKGKGKVTVDFLIAPTDEKERGGTIRNIESDFAAIVTPGLSLAFKDTQRVALSGETILGEKAAREIPVCGPGAYIVLKALAFQGRGENKDAYDLWYVLRHFGSGVDDVFRHLELLSTHPQAQRALKVLRRDFANPQMLGPRRVADFLFKRADANTQRDVVADVKALLDRFE